MTDDVDWAIGDLVDGAPWYGVRKGKDGVGAFFEAFGKAMEVEEFTPLAFAATDDGDVLSVVRFATRSRETGKLRRMDLHHWFRFTNGKIVVLPGHRGHRDHRGRASLTPSGPPRRANMMRLRASALDLACSFAKVRAGALRLAHAAGEPGRTVSSWIDGVRGGGRRRDGRHCVRSDPSTGKDPSRRRSCGPRRPIRWPGHAPPGWYRRTQSSCSSTCTRTSTCS